MININIVIFILMNIVLYFSLTYLLNIYQQSHYDFKKLTKSFRLFYLTKPYMSLSYISIVCLLINNISVYNNLKVALEAMGVTHPAEQKKRIEALESDVDTRWRVSDNDKWQNKHYDKCLEAFGKYMEATNAPSAPWYIIESKSKKWAELQVLETITQGIEVALQNQSLAVPLLQNPFPLAKIPKLSEIPLDKMADEDTYKEELDALQERLGELHNRLYRKKVPVVILYEGWDAAGKGGNIKRITSALDPRGYEVHPIASPEPHEKARHYLWRFWTRLPKTGHIAIFDRSWYGRVMVERLEGFCSENDWKRAYHEMNEFEKELHDWGAVIIKFWVQIDKDTQLARFNDRQNTPEKQWKITEEDWRNREKWDQYEVAIDEMIQKTSTTYAPWHILESVDKKYARLKALKIVIEELEKVL